MKNVGSSGRTSKPTSALDAGAGLSVYAPGWMNPSDISDVSDVIFGLVALAFLLLFLFIVAEFFRR